MITDPDSPAGMLWRISWLAGTAVPVPWYEKPEPEPPWLQAPTLAEIGAAPPRRSRLRDSIRVEVHREAERVYVAAQREMSRQISAAYSVPPAQIGRLRAASYRYIAEPVRCVECEREASAHRRGRMC